MIPSQSLTRRRGEKKLVQKQTEWVVDRPSPDVAACRRALLETVLQINANQWLMLVDKLESPLNTTCTWRRTAWKKVPRWWGNLHTPSKIPVKLTAGYYHDIRQNYGDTVLLGGRKLAACVWTLGNIKTMRAVKPNFRSVRHWIRLTSAFSSRGQACLIKLKPPALWCITLDFWRLFLIVRVHIRWHHTFFSVTAVVFQTLSKELP